MRTCLWSKTAVLVLHALLLFQGTPGQKDDDDESKDDWCAANCGETMSDEAASKGWCEYCNEEIAGGEDSSDKDEDDEDDSSDKDEDESLEDWCAANCGENVDEDAASNGWCAVCGSGGAAGQTSGNLTWAGQTRHYVMYEPSSAPTGLVIALVPMGADAMGMGCSSTVGLVSRDTGALVVCPAAALGEASDGSGKDSEGSAAGPCWKAFANFGYCLNGAPEGPEDVNFLGALIQYIKGQHSIPEGRTIVAGFSNGGSMAYRFHCEKSELFDALVVWGQSWLDPYVGYFDYDNMQALSGVPQCNPTCRRPLYSAVGTDDAYYGQPPAHAGLEAVENWRNYSTQVLGCEGASVVSSTSTRILGGEATRYEYPSCPKITSPGINKMFSVSGVGHDGPGLGVLVTMAFTDLFSGATSGIPTTCSVTSTASSVDSAFSTASSFSSLLSIAMLLSLQRP